MKEEYKITIGFLFVLGFVLISIGMVPGVLLYPGKGPPLGWGYGFHYVRFLLLEDPARWMWILGLVCWMITFFLFRKGKIKASSKHENKLSPKC